MLEIIFAVLFMTATGTQQRFVTEAAKFEKMDDCIAFGELMIPRVADYVRGHLQQEWDDPIVVTFRCKPVETT